MTDKNEIMPSTLPVIASPTIASPTIASWWHGWRMSWLAACARELGVDPALAPQLIKEKP